MPSFPFWCICKCKKILFLHLLRLSLQPFYCVLGWSKHMVLYALTSGDPHRFTPVEDLDQEEEDKKKKSFSLEYETLWPGKQILSATGYLLKKMILPEYQSCPFGILMAGAQGLVTRWCPWKNFLNWWRDGEEPLFIWCAFLSTCEKLLTAEIKTYHCENHYNLILT